MDDVLGIKTIDGVECYELDGTVYLKLETAARGLGFTDTRGGVEYVRWNTVRSHLSSIGFSQLVAKDDFIPENVFYRLAMKARNSVAEAFQAKVADEIIPSIRKHGGYLTTEALERVMNDPDAWITMLTALKEERQKNNELTSQIEQQKPLVEFAETVQGCETNILVREMAKIASNHPGIHIGEKSLYQKLREWGLILKKCNEPSQVAIDLGILVRVERNILRGNHSDIVHTTKVTPKGQIYIVRRLLQEVYQLQPA